VTTYTITREVLPEQIVPGKRLGRHIWHDSRSRDYAVDESPAGALASMTWERHIPILDQGNVGSCTGNAMCGALGTSPIYDALPSGHSHLGEAEALRIYSEAEDIDGDGPYPPNDYGSYGLSVAKAAKNDGLIPGYLHAFSLSGLQTALQTGPVIVGVNWYTSMDSPDSRGLITVGGSVRGGHELAARQLDMAGGVIWLDNSWGPGWGLAGRCCIRFADFSRLMSEGGDVTVPLPLSEPPPQPVPWQHPDIQFGHDQRVIDWAAAAASGALNVPVNEAYAAQQYQAWRKARGYA